MKSSLVLIETVPIGSLFEKIRLPCGTNCVLHELYPAFVIVRCPFETYLSVVLKSAGVIHIISPSQYSSTDVDGVAPVKIAEQTSFVRLISQCVGISPRGEDLVGTPGFSPCATVSAIFDCLNV